MVSAVVHYNCIVHCNGQGPCRALQGPVAHYNGQGQEQWCTTTDRGHVTTTGCHYNGQEAMSLYLFIPPSKVDSGSHLFKQRPFVGCDCKSRSAAALSLEKGRHTLFPWVVVAPAERFGRFLRLRDLRLRDLLRFLAFLTCEGPMLNSKTRM